jgi:WD40 repeat protein
VWDVAKGGEPVLVFPFDAPIRQRDVAFLPDSRAVLIAGPSGTSVVDVATGRESRHIEGAFAPIAVSPDGRRLAAALDPGALVLGTLDPSTGALTARLAGHSERVDRLVFSTDGELVASGDDEGTVMLWDAATGARRSLFDGHAAGVRGLAFTHDSRMLYSSSLDHVVYAWDLRRSRTLAHRLPPDRGDLQPLAFGVEEQVISDDGGAVMYLAAGDDRVQFRDTATGALTPPATFGFFLDFSPDARRFVTSPMDGTLKEWDRASQTLVATRSPDAGAYIAAAYTPDGHRLVAAQVDQNNDHPSLDVLDADTLEPVGGQALPIKIWPRAIEVTPDGRRALAVLSAYDHLETKVILVDLSSRHILRSTPVDFGSAARNNAFASDGHTVGVGANTGEVRIVDAETGKMSPPLLAHDGIVESVSFSPDVQTFVTTGRDGAVRLWTTATHQLLDEMQPLGPNKLVRARFVASDRLLISYSTGELFEWDPRPGSWEAYACRVAGRNLTKAEWADLFPKRPYHSTCAQFPPGD